MIAGKEVSHKIHVWSIYIHFMSSISRFVMWANIPALSLGGVNGVTWICDCWMQKEKVTRTHILPNGGNFHGDESHAIILKKSPKQSHPPKNIQGLRESYFTNLHIGGFSRHFYHQLKRIFFIKRETQTNEFTLWWRSEVECVAWNNPQER